MTTFSSCSLLFITPVAVGILNSKNVEEGRSRVAKVWKECMADAPQGHLRLTTKLNHKLVQFDGRISEVNPSFRPYMTTWTRGK